MQTDPDVPASLALDEWLDRLAEPTGAPGGGSAAGVMMALAAALLHMVCGYTRDDPEADRAAERVRVLRAQCLDAAYQDGIRSVALGEALAAEGADRSANLHAAAIAAAESSARLAEIGIALGGELRAVAVVGNRNLVADTGVAGEALRAGLGAALINLRANVRLAEAHADGDAADGLDALTGVSDRGEAARGEVDAVLASLPLS